MLASVLDPLYQLMAAILAAIYSVIPNYAVAILGLTCIVLAILTPLTLKGLRSTIKIQKLMPEQKRLQAQFKDDRQALNEAIMAMYKENKVSPVGGCLPFLVQSPFFIALFGVLRGMSRVRYYNPSAVSGKPFAEWGAPIKLGRGKKPPADAIRLGDPQHLPTGSKLYHSLRGLDPSQWFEASGLKRLSHAPGEVKAFGFDLAKSASQMVSQGFVKFLPYLVLIVLMIGLQVFAQRQVNRRNPAAAAANPQMQTVTKLMPFLFGIWGWAFQAGLTLYWTTSSALRIGQQWALYRFDPTLAESVKEKQAELAKEAVSGKKSGGGAGKAKLAKGQPARMSGGRLGGGGKPPKAGAKPSPKPKIPAPAAKPATPGGAAPANAQAGPRKVEASNGITSGPPRPNPGRQQPKKRRKGR
ncbi:MAG: YidC/Oxa1 family membrane protein insertase [Acidimicrobiales bacterium]